VKVSEREDHLAVAVEIAETAESVASVETAETEKADTEDEMLVRARKAVRRVISLLHCESPIFLKKNSEAKLANNTGGSRGGFGRGRGSGPGAAQ
jgi:hypothetical protein